MARTPHRASRPSDGRILPRCGPGGAPEGDGPRSVGFAGRPSWRSAVAFRHDPTSAAPGSPRGQCPGVAPAPNWSLLGRPDSSRSRRDWPTESARREPRGGAVGLAGVDRVPQDTTSPESRECEEERSIPPVRQEGGGGSQPEPADLVHLVLRADRARHRPHGPVPDPLRTSGSGEVRRGRKLDAEGAPQTRLFLDFAARARLVLLVAAQLALRKRPVLAMRAVDDQHLAAAAGALAVHDAAGRTDGLHGSLVRPTPGATLFIVRHCHASPALAARKYRSDVAHSSSERNRIETDTDRGGARFAARAFAEGRNPSPETLSRCCRNVLEAVGRGSDRRRARGSVRSVRRVGSDVPRRGLRDRRDGCSRAERKLHSRGHHAAWDALAVFTMASAQAPGGVTR